MLPSRPYWKGHLKLSLVSCQVALYSAASSSDRVAFRQINRKTGNRLKQRLVDEITGDTVETADKGRGYEVEKHVYLMIEDEELEAIALESSHTIDIDRFVPRAQIDERYIDSPYYLLPEEKVGQEAFAVIREAMRGKSMVALGRVVMAKRERVIMLQPWGKGLLGTTLRYAYEIREDSQYFDYLPDVTVPKDMLGLAEHILDSKAGDFEPETFVDRYEEAVTAMIAKKQGGVKPSTKRASEPPSGNVIDLMAALKASLAGMPKPTEVIKPKKPRKRIAGQQEMLLPISGSGKEKAAAGKAPVKTVAKSTETKPSEKSSRKKAG